MSQASLLAFALMACAMCSPTYSQQLDGNEDNDRSWLGQLPTMPFVNSCAPEVQKKLQHAVELLHLFWLPKTENAFREVLAADPSCAVATWGIAASLINPLNGEGSTREGAKDAIAAINRGRTAAAKTQRERDYIEAAAAYYDTWEQRSEHARQATLVNAFRRLAARYPDDGVARTFSTLYKVSLQSLAERNDSNVKQKAERAKPALPHAVTLRQPGTDDLAHRE